MSYFADLTPYSYAPDREEGVSNIGWLDRGHDFMRGGLDPDLALASFSARGGPSASCAAATNAISATTPEREWCGSVGNDTSCRSAMVRFA